MIEIHSLHLWNLGKFRTTFMQFKMKNTTSSCHQHLEQHLKQHAYPTVCNEFSSKRKWTIGSNSAETTRRNKNDKSRSETVPNLKMLCGGFNCGYNVCTRQYNHKDTPINSFLKRLAQRKRTKVGLSYLDCRLIRRWRWGPFEMDEAEESTGLSRKKNGRYYHESHFKLIDKYPTIDE